MVQMEEEGGVEGQEKVPSRSREKKKKDWSCPREWKKNDKGKKERVNEKR
jgi:hypothetical protein